MGGQTLKRFKVNAKAPRRVPLQPAEHRHAALIDDSGIKRHIGRREQQHAVAGLRQAGDALLDGRDDAAAGNELLCVRIPAEAPPHPAGHRAVVSRVDQAAVAENAAVKPPVHGVENRLRTGKVHVRNPHGDGIRRQVGTAASERLKLDAVGAAAVDDLIKLVLHTVPFFV